MAENMLDDYFDKIDEDNPDNNSETNFECDEPDENPGCISEN
jgi:hypothetical protein